jgi:hypothetical protein
VTQRRLCFLCGADVAKALPMKEAVAAMKGAFRQLPAGQAVGAYRPTVHEVPGEGRGRSS